jgi:hypothetical protein
MLLRDMVGLITSPWVRRYGALKRIIVLLTVESCGEREVEVRL